MVINNNKDAGLIFCLRITLGAVWLYNGLWLKVITLDHHHLEIMQSVCGTAGSGLSATDMLRLIGGCETLLAVGIISGLFHRFVNFFQIAVLILMNIIGSASAGGAIPHPFGLVISNLPTIMCAYIVATRGPGTWALSLPKSHPPKRPDNVWH